MKKAKIMLMVLGIIGVVSGAMAFKAKKFNGTWFCSTTSTTKNCPGVYTTACAQPTTRLYCTQDPTATCSMLKSVCVKA